MSHGDHVEVAPAGFTRHGDDPSVPVAATEDPARGSTASSSTRRSPTRRTAQAPPAELPHETAACSGDWTHGNFIEHRSRPSASRWARQGDLRPLRRRGFGGGGAAAAQGHRQSAHLRLRGPRPAAQGRGGRRCRPVPRPLQHQRWSRGRLRRSSSGRWQASPIPSRSGRSSAASSSRCSSARPASVKARIPGAGHALPRRDRDRSGTGGPSALIKSHHNVGGLPERMKLKLVEPLRELFKDEVRALGRGAGPARRDASAAALPRARAWPCASWARSPGSGSTILRERRRHRHRGDPGGRPVRRRSGRPSPCCCPCRPWASWATSAPTSTCAPCAPSPVEDFMTADWARLPHELLATHRQRIVNEVQRHQPRGLRHHLETARHHRIRMSINRR